MGRSLCLRRSLLLTDQRRAEGGAGARRPGLPKAEADASAGPRRRRRRLDLYGHLYPGDMDRYADQLDSAVDEVAPNMAPCSTKRPLPGAGRGL
jgi:hypothetical protein